MTKEHKKRRLHLKETRSSQTIKRETREGITYQTCMAIDPEFQDNVESIPEIMSPPPVQHLPSDNYVKVFVDLETTGLGNVHINVFSSILRGILLISLCM